MLFLCPLPPLFGDPLETNQYNKILALIKNVCVCKPGRWQAPYYIRQPSIVRSVFLMPMYKVYVYCL